MNDEHCGRTMSPAGSSKCFDGAAHGNSKAEVVNAIPQKKLRNAIRDGDPVRAVIKVTAIIAGG